MNCNDDYDDDVSFEYPQYSLIYGSSKAALDMVTKTAAKELGPKGIRVNSIKYVCCV